MDALAVILEKPEQLTVARLPLSSPTDDDLVVDIEWSGISTGTERLLFTGRMPPFPGLGYPLVPGYESVGRVVTADKAGVFKAGQRVFVPGARCFGDVRGLFGGAASRLVVPAARVTAIDDHLGEQGVLLALAATAYHAVAGGSPPELIVGHGVLGRLLARLAVALGGQPVVWEKHPARMSGAVGYDVVVPSEDDRSTFGSIYDVSGDAGLLDTLIARLAKGGEVTLAGFYSERLSFAFPAAFMKEARFRVAAEWGPEDLAAVVDLIGGGRLGLDGLITHRHEIRGSSAAPTEAYTTAFDDPTCLKMLLDWRQTS